MGIHTLISKVKERKRTIAKVCRASSRSSRDVSRHLDKTCKSFDVTYYQYLTWELWKYDGDALAEECTRHKNEVQKNREKCIEDTMTATGWDRDTAIAHIEKTRREKRVYYSQYTRWKLYRFTREFSREECKLSKKAVCRLLKIPYDGHNEYYTTLTFANKAAEGGLAIIQHRRMDPYLKLTDDDMEQLSRWAISSGAKCLLTTKQIRNYPCIIVPEPVMDSVQKIVHMMRQSIDVRAIEVTGSYGKTTVTSMLEFMLGSKFNVSEPLGENKNMLPHAMKRLLSLPEDTEIFVQEVEEAPHFGVPGIVSDMIVPEIGIVTSVGTSHLEHIGGRNQILDSCMSIQNGICKDGVLLLNGDNPELFNVQADRKVIYYGMYNEKVDCRAVNVRQTLNSLEFDILYNGETTPITLNCIGHHNAQNAAGVFAAGKLMGMTNEEAAYGLSLYHPEGLRQRLYRSRKYQFYLDCYNASMETMISAIDAICSFELDKGGRRVAVLADILQLGDETENHHRAVGRHVRDSGIDVLICLGESAKFIAEEARQRETLTVHVVDSHEEAADLLKKLLTPADIVLFKSSHAMELPRIPEALTGKKFS